MADSENHNNNKTLFELAKGGVILIVDDNSAHAHMLALLMGINHKVVTKTFTNLKDARAFIESSATTDKPVMGIVTDDEMIGEQGRDFVQAVKDGSVPSLSRNTPVVLVTGTSDLVGDHIITKARSDEAEAVAKTLRHMLEQNELAAANKDHAPEERKMSPNEMRRHVKSLGTRLELDI